MRWRASLSEPGFDLHQPNRLFCLNPFDSQSLNRWEVILFTGKLSRRWSSRLMLTTVTLFITLKHLFYERVYITWLYTRHNERFAERNLLRKPISLSPNEPHPLQNAGYEFASLFL